MTVKTLVAAILLAAAAPALAQSAGRAQKSEIYLSPVFTESKTYTSEGGASASVDTGFGMIFGYAYNVDDKLSFGAELGWGEADYRATVLPGVGNAGAATNIRSTLETWTVRFVGNYNFSAGNFTPFVTGGLGWTTIDSNIPTGLPQNVCWYYPWYGQYCSSYVPTATTTKFSYNAGAGLRYDFGAGFVRGLVNAQWVDFGSSYGSAQITSYRFDIGTKFR